MGNTCDCTVPGLLFALRALVSGLWKSGAERTEKEASKLSLDFSCQWRWLLRRGGLLRFAPLSCPTPRLTAPRGGSLIVGVFAPVWTWGRGVGVGVGGRFTWRLREEAALVERRRSSAEQRGEERSCAGETADHPSTGGTHTNKPLWLLEKYRSVPPSPSFLFLGDFWLLNVVQSRSLWQV